MVIAWWAVGVAYGCIFGDLQRSCYSILLYKYLQCMLHDSYSVWKFHDSFVYIYIHVAFAAVPFNGRVL